MKQKLLALLLCILLIGNIVLTAGASDTLPAVIDQANLLTREEVSSLEDMAQSLRRTYEMDVVILTVESLDGYSAQTYADDYYDNNGYANDGLLFLLAIKEREWHISTCGNAIYAFTDYGLDRLGELVVPYLSDGEYYEGFCAYLEELSVYFDEYRRGTPIDAYVDSYSPEYREDVVYYEPHPQVTIGSVLPLSLLIGFIAALVTVLIMAHSMNTKRKQHSAVDYLKQDSYHLRLHRDLFLYSNVKKIRRQQNTSHSGGGSHVHRSSGGRSHGGRGGRF